MKWTVGVQHQSPRSYDFLEMQHKMGVGVALNHQKYTISSDFLEHQEMWEAGTSMTSLLRFPQLS